MYMLDTCIFNKLLDRKIKPEELPSNGEFYATHIQIDEIKKTSDANRREALLSKFKELIQPETIATETFLADISHVDLDKIGSGVWYSKLHNKLDSLNKRKRNNPQDSLIAEAAFMNDFTLLTADKDLSIACEQLGAKVIYFETY
ncbi:hypothetical protein [Pseudomonas sp. RA_105y_Pfl2_P56]|uniref:hypothetical protein n=1 Tax=Pseudomonas sp. RA_105y_Pfl2_P56 TaxID=3088701 RepID=UPI0030DCACAF